MPEPGNSRIPTLSTFAEIGRFCNPITTTSIAVICNATPWSVIQELLENARTKAFNTGRKKGYDEARHLAKEDEEKARNAAFEQGRKEGEEHGRMAERESWEMSHGPDKCEE
jgi:hypothetical protein